MKETKTKYYNSCTKFQQELIDALKRIGYEFVHIGNLYRNIEIGEI